MMGARCRSFCGARGGLLWGRSLPCHRGVRQNTRARVRSARWDGGEGCCIQRPPKRSLPAGLDGEGGARWRTSTLEQPLAPSPSTAAALRPHPFTLSTMNARCVLWTRLSFIVLCCRFPGRVRNPEGDVSRCRCCAVLTIPSSVFLFFFFSCVLRVAVPLRGPKPFALFRVG